MATKDDFETIYVASIRLRNGKRIFVGRLGENATVTGFCCQQIYDTLGHIKTTSFQELNPKANDPYPAVTWPHRTVQIN